MLPSSSIFSDSMRRSMSCSPPRTWTTTSIGSSIPFAGAGSVNLLNSTVVGNLNHRFYLYPNFWLEPTVGASYTNSSYGSGAAQLGLANGNLVRVQGGSRFGTSTVLSNGVVMTSVLTGLAYSNVVVQGGVFPGVGVQGNNLLAQSDEGYMRGQGILRLNFDFGRGLKLGFGARRMFTAGRTCRRWRQGRSTLPVVRADAARTPPANLPSRRCAARGHG